MSCPGVSKVINGKGQVKYRSSLTYRRKHISLGTFDRESDAAECCAEARKLLSSPSHGPHSNREPVSDTSQLISEIESETGSLLYLSKDRAISLINLRNNGIYIRTPIYLLKNFFLYFLRDFGPLRFDTDDLFFYSSHTIQRRGGCLFVSNYGSQESILCRYGIKKRAVLNRDYIFANGDDHDYRYDNIKVINGYYGVEREVRSGIISYKSSILVNGRIIIGRYSTEIQAATAYNKAADYLTARGLKRRYELNYIPGLSSREYAKIYSEINLPPHILSITH